MEMDSKYRPVPAPVGVASVLFLIGDPVHQEKTREFQGEATAPVNPLILALKFQEEGKAAEAEELFRRILTVAPTHAQTLFSLALLLMNSHRHQEALLFAAEGVKANPDFAQLWFIHGELLKFFNRREEALASFERALAVNPDYVEVLVNGGVLLHELNRPKEALLQFQHALAVEPDHGHALANYGILLSEFKLLPQAVAAFERLVGKNPEYAFGLGLLCYERMHLCDWTDLEATALRITEGLRQGKMTCKTLAYMALSDSVEDHFLCAKIFADHCIRKETTPLWTGQRYRHVRKRIAYVSPDFREHPVGHLLAGVIESHDKSRFEVIGISLGLDDHSRIRARLTSAFDQFIDARDMYPRQIAELMRQMEVDVAIDLAGYTTDSRTEIFLHRPAPVQVNYLGYPGTLGLECYDYILADRTVIPEAHRGCYTEKVAYLDHCYLPLPMGLAIAEPLPRADYGLPESGFVFCAFSHDYKIHPAMFAIWMRLLESNPGSVLWLVSRNEVSQRNLRQAAKNHGILPERLVFASRLPKIEDHLARYRVADLFLDSWPYNAHTTCADALLAGLPAITYQGNAFPARVASSLLTALGLEDLITCSFDDYFQLADCLAHDPARLRELKDRLAPAALSGHPFLGECFTRSLERALDQLQPDPGLLRDGETGTGAEEVPRQPQGEPATTCRLCGSPCRVEFSREVLSRYAVTYFRCLSCGSLQTEPPYWLEEAWAHGTGTSDTGKASRTLMDFLLVRRIFEILGIRPDYRCADYGSDTGLFARLMRDMGYDFFSYDRHGAGEFCAGHTLGAMDRPLKVVTLLESAERFANPDAEWATLFATHPDYIIGSLEFYADQGADWKHLAPESGRQVFFHSITALTAVAAQRGWSAYLAGRYFILSRFSLPGNVMEGLKEWGQDPAGACQETLAAWVKHPFVFAAADLRRGAALANLRRSGGRIALDGVFFSYRTGISRVWTSLLAEWSANGFGEFVIVLDRGRTAPRFPGITYVDVPAHDYSDLQADRRMLQEICDRERISLFTSTYYTIPLRTPAVLMVHDMIPEVVGGFDLDAEMWREKHEAIRYCRRYLCVSNSTAQDLMRIFPEVTPECVVVTHGGTGFRAQSAETVQQFQNRYGIDRPYFLISGGKSYGYKNSQLFFNAFALLGERRGEFSIVCTNALPVLEPHFAACAGDAKVHLVVLSDEEMQCAYTGASALVYPSRYEGFGLPLVEAMACSCPVITCNNSSLGEVAGDAALFVDPDDPVEMQRALLLVLQKSVRDDLILKGNLRANQFSWRRMADGVESALVRWALNP